MPKEERLEMIAENTKPNGVPPPAKKAEEYVSHLEDDPCLQRTGR